MLCNDEAITIDVIKSVKVADPKLARDNLRFGSGTNVYTLRSFLSANAIRAKNSMDDIDDCSTNNSTTNASLRWRARPTKIITIEGAVYGLTPCPACEKSPGQHSNTLKNFFDHVAKWIAARY